MSSIRDGDILCSEDPKVTVDTQVPPKREELQQAFTEALAFERRRRAVTALFRAHQLEQRS